MSSKSETGPDLAPVRVALGHLVISIENGMMPIRRLNSRACRYVHYETADGWKLSVFNDAGVWDFLEQAIDPQGRVLDYGEIQKIQGIDWRAIGDHECWGRFLLHAEFDPEYPDEEEDDRYNSP